jgi:hypothetical protein
MPQQNYLFKTIHAVELYSSGDLRYTISALPFIDLHLVVHSFNEQEKVLLTIIPKQQEENNNIPCFEDENIKIFLSPYYTVYSTPYSQAEAKMYYVVLKNDESALHNLNAACDTLETIYDLGRSHIQFAPTDYKGAENGLDNDTELIGNDPD